MIAVLIRSIILYIAVLIAVRVMGKAEIAEMNTFDLVITLLIAEVAAVPMENNNIPIINGIAALTGLVLLQTLGSYIALKNRRFSTFFSGKPTILINKGKIDIKSLKKERITLDELLEQLRTEGYFNLKDIQYAILETGGDLSIVPSSTYESTPPRPFKHLPVALILDGKILKEGLEMVNKDINWLMGMLKSNNISDSKDVIVCILDENDKLFIQPKNN